MSCLGSNFGARCPRIWGQLARVRRKLVLSWDQVGLQLGQVGLLLCSLSYSLGAGDTCREATRIKWMHFIVFPKYCNNSEITRWLELLQYLVIFPISQLQLLQYNNNCTDCLLALSIFNLYRALGVNGLSTFNWLIKRRTLLRIMAGHRLARRDSTLQKAWGYSM